MLPAVAVARSSSDDNGYYVTYFPVFVDSDVGLPRISFWALKL